MAATYLDISAWFNKGVHEGATHMIVVCDTYDHEDYPVYVKPGTDPRTTAQEYTTSTQRVMEVYVLDPVRKQSQMKELRAFHYEPFDPTPEPPHWSDAVYEACQRYIVAFSENGRSGSMTEARELFEATQQIREAVANAPTKF